MNPPPDLDLLLREGPWLRRLARALAGEGGEDLSQEVLAAALEGEPPRERARLRPWLRTIARRMARRTAERARSRGDAEAAAAGDADPGPDAAARIAAQEAVARALSRVEEPYRSAVVLRYFDDLHSRDIADRLGISPTAARKRVSRGVARLRVELEREHGPDARLWSAVLIPLARLRTPAASAAGVAVPGLAIVMSLKSSAAVALALTIAVLFLQPWEADGRGAGEPDRGVARADTVPMENADPVVSAADGEAGRTEVTVGVDAPPSPSAPRVRIVAPDGSSLEDVRAAWITETGVVRALDLDEDHSVERPDGDLRWIVAAAQGFLPIGVDVDGAGSVEVVLDPGRAVRGRVIEDGGEPIEPVTLMVSPSAEFEEAARAAGQSTLEGLGLRPRTSFAAVNGSLYIHTDSDGTYRIDGIPASWDVAHFWAFAHRRVRPREVDSNGHNVHHLARLPTVRGRLVYADDGQPVAGELSVWRRDRRTGTVSGATLPVGPDGTFEFGADVEVPDGVDTCGDTEPRLIHDRMVFGVGSIDGVADVESIEVELDGAVFPIELGTIEVARAPVMHVQVERSGGGPIESAAVTTSGHSARTDASGRATIEALPGATLEVLGPGTRLVRVVTPAEATSPADPVEVELPEGHALSITPPEPRPDTLRVEWERMPFERSQLERPHAHGFPSRLQLTLDDGHRSSGYGPAEGFIEWETPGEGDVVVSGLRPGASLRAVVKDVIGQPMVVARVTVPAEPGMQHVDLRRGGRGDVVRHPVGRLAVAITGADGELLEGASVSLTRVDVENGEYGSRRTGTGGTAVFDPLVHGVYSVRAIAKGHVATVRGRVDAGADSPPIEIRLPPSREVTLDVSMDDGSAAAVTFARARSSGGWEEQARGDWSTGSLRWPNAPQAPLEIEIEVGDREFRRTIERDESEARLQLPPQ